MEGKDRHVRYDIVDNQKNESLCGLWLQRKMVEEDERGPSHIGKYFYAKFLHTANENRELYSK